MISNLTVWSLLNKNNLQYDPALAHNPPAAKLLLVIRPLVQLVGRLAFERLGPESVRGIGVGGVVQVVQGVPVRQGHASKLGGRMERERGREKACR